MAGYLDNFGVSDAKREHRTKTILLAVLGIVVVTLGGYWFLHDYQEKRQVSRFMNLLEEKKYEDAYRLWGCDPAKPCRDYNLAKFMEDWGPKSPHPDITQAHVRRTRSCDTGIIQILQYKPGDEVFLYVDRTNRNIGFSPFDYCVDAGGKNTKFWDIFFR